MNKTAARTPTPSQELLQLLESRVSSHRDDDAPRNQWDEREQNQQTGSDQQKSQPNVDGRFQGPIYLGLVVRKLV